MSVTNSFETKGVTSMVSTAIRVASVVADVLVHEGGIPTWVAQLLMDRLADGLEAGVQDGSLTPHQLVMVLTEMRLVTDIRDMSTPEEDLDEELNS